MPTQALATAPPADEAAKMARLLALIAEAEAEYAAGLSFEVADEDLDAWMAARGSFPRE